MLSVEDIRTVMTPIARRYALRKATLFGSYARGDAREASDVDIVVEPSGPLGFARGAVCSQLEEGLGTSVDVIFGEKNPYPFVRHAYEREGVVLYEA